MATTQGTDPAAPTVADAPHTLERQQDQASSNNLEMSNLQASTNPTSDPTSSSEPQSSSEAPREEADATAGAPADQPLSSTPKPTRKQSEALGPATENPIAAPTASAGPSITITLMLTTGARHPYKIDEKYLRNRQVNISTLRSNPDADKEDVEQREDGSTFDPLLLSGYKLKELIWTDWRSEWEPRPTSPSSIRLIILGRFIDDKAALKDLPFKLDDTNVVHMTVKPADIVDDDETAGKGTGKGHSIRGQDTEERGAGCRCVIL